MSTVINPSQEEIEILAKKKWEEAGKPYGEDQRFYYDAVNELRLKSHVKNRESCREVYRDKKMHVVEYEPQVRVLKFKIHGQHFMHYLSMPYMQFTRYLGEQGLSLHVGFTTKPLKSINDPVYFPPLPNVWWPSLQVCLMHCPGTSFEDVMKDFWNTRYLDCEDWYCFPVLDHELPMRTYKNWEKMTLEDPTFIQKVEWTHPAFISQIPDYDVKGKACNKSTGAFPRSGKPEYGGSSTNRTDGPIRGFAVVHYDDVNNVGRRTKILD